MIKVKNIVKNCVVYIVEDKITSVSFYDYDCSFVCLVDGTSHRIPVEDAKRIIQELEKRGK